MCAKFCGAIFYGNYIAQEGCMMLSMSTAAVTAPSHYSGHYAAGPRSDSYCDHRVHMRAPVECFHLILVHDGRYH